MKRKVVSLLLAIILVFSSLQIIVAEEPANDVKYEVDPMEQISEGYTEPDTATAEELFHTEEASHTDRHSDGIYGLVISPLQAYLLVGDTLRLTAEFLTEPPAEEETHFDGAEEADDQTTAQHTDTEISEEPTSETIDDEQLAETTSDLTDDQTEAEVERNEETETSTENVTENPTEESTIFTTTELEEGGEREVVTEAATDILEEESTTLAEAEPEAVSASRLPADPDELMWNSSNEEVAASEPAAW